MPLPPTDSGGGQLQADPGLVRVRGSSKGARVGHLGIRCLSRSTRAGEGGRGSSIRRTPGVRFSPAPAPCQTRRGPCMGQEARAALRVVPNSGSRRLCRPRPIPSSRSSACDASKPQLAPADPAHAAGLCELPSCDASGAPGSFRPVSPREPSPGLLRCDQPSALSERPRPQEDRAARARAARFLLETSSRISTEGTLATRLKMQRNLQRESCVGF